MKVLVYCSIAVYSPRLEVLLSVTQERIDAGDDVVFVGCDGCLPACVVNLGHAKAICRYCMARKDKGLDLVTDSFARRDLSDYVAADELRRIVDSRDDFPDVEALRSLEHRGADVGYAALSSYNMATREPAPDLADPSRRRSVQRLVNTGKLVHAAFTRALDAERPALVILFNGRLAADRAAFRVCRSAGVECRVYEVTQKADHVVYFENALPQDIAYNVRVIEEFWAQAPAEKLEIARSFYEHRRNGIYTNDDVYIEGQVAGRMPEGWNDGARNVVIFGSSEDEFAAIGREWDAKIYSSQAEAVRRICAGLADDVTIRVYLRIHPNLAGIDSAYVREMRDLGGTVPNLTVIPADSEISSYAVLDRATTVVAFGSTMGIEAVYWGKPCILLAASFYKSLGVTYNPQSHDEVIDLLRTDLSPMDPTPALKVGYHRMKYGYRQPYFEGDWRLGPRRGFSFKSDRIRVRGLRRLLYKIAKKRALRASPG